MASEQLEAAIEKIGGATRDLKTHIEQRFGQHEREDVLALAKSLSDTHDAVNHLIGAVQVLELRVESLAVRESGVRNG